jgi:hypothetical protein
VPSITDSLDTPSSSHFGAVFTVPLREPNDALAGFSDITLKLQDPNDNIFPMPQSCAHKQQSASSRDAALTPTPAMEKKDVAIEKAIVTRKILRVSAWDRVVSVDCTPLLP